jgi:hypothetical protein
MIFRYCFILTVILNFFANKSTFAQDDTGHQCGTDHFNQRLMATDPNYAKQRFLIEQQVQQKILQLKNSRLQETVYTIPVVFHIIHTGGATGTSYNPSDANITAALALLNESFRKTNATNSGGSDIEVDFVLATRGPGCVATSGINRIDFSSNATYVASGVNAGTAGVAETTVKALSRWSNTDYINIWVVNKIDNFDGYSGGGTAGYAYFPGASSEVDGIVLLAATVNGTSKTLIHEMGHVFNLYHTFEGDGSGSTCPPPGANTTDGDRVADTEAHKRGACGTGLTNSCTGATYLIADAAKTYTVLNNHMNYANSGCRWMFTDGQKTRMRAALLSTRIGLTTSLGASATSPSATPVATLSYSNSPTYYIGGSTYYACSGGFVIDVNNSISKAWDTFEWLKDGVLIAGQTNSFYAPSASGVYTARVTRCGASSTTSSGTTFSLLSAPSGVTVAGGTSFCTGSSVVIQSSTGNDITYSYQWKSGGSSISGATSWNYTANATGLYTLTISRCGSAFTTPGRTITAFATAPTANCGFSVASSAGIGTGSYFGINNVTIGSINFSSSSSLGDGANYFDRSCTSNTTTFQGATLPISVTGHHTNGHKVRVYIDYNNDGDFNDANETVSTASGNTSGSTGGNIYTGSVVIPSTVPLTNTLLRMRVVADWTGYTDPTACASLASGTNGSTYGAGQAEDYGLIVSSSLPVDLVWFKAALQTPNSVAIRWQTASELNSQSFIVEKSQTIDGFEAVAVLNAKGNSSQLNTYELEDNNPNIGQNYYRLKSLDLDGSYSYSRPVAVWVENPSELVTVYPNPSEQRQFNVQLSNAQNANFAMSNTLGQGVLIKTQVKNENTIQVICPASTPSGNYLLMIKQLNGREITKKITFE